MKLTKKHIMLGGIAILSLATMSFTSAKKAQAGRLFEKIKFGIAGFGRVGIKLPTTLWFDVSIVLQNSTAEDFSISSGGFIQPKVLRVYNGDEELGFGAVDNLYSLQLRAGERAVIENIRITLDMLSTGGILYEAYKKYGDNYKQYVNVLNTFRFELDIDAFGQILTFHRDFSVK